MRPACPPHPCICVHPHITAPPSLLLLLIPILIIIVRFLLLRQNLSSNPDAQTAVVGTGSCTKNRPCVWVYACRHNKDSQTDAEMRLFLACKIEQALAAGGHLREIAREQQAEVALEETLSGKWRSGITDHSRDVLRCNSSR